MLLTSGPSSAAEIAPTRFVTANGITVLVLEQHFLPIVEIHALIKTGSAQDPPDKAGLANLVASLLDEGTTTRTSKQMAEQIDFVGGTLEAKASEDFTTASARVLKKDIDLGFTLLADMLQRPAFSKQEFERIRTQLLGEMASDNDDPGHIAMKAFNQLVFHGHPYRWPVNGTEETLNKITLADVQMFYGREYSPPQTILTVVGDVTLEQATALVQIHFETWKKGAPTARITKKPAPIERKAVQLIEKDLTQSTIVLGHRQMPSIGRINPSRNPLQESEMKYGTQFMHEVAAQGQGAGRRAHHGRGAELLEQEPVVRGALRVLPQLLDVEVAKGAGDLLLGRELAWGHAAASWRLSRSRTTLGDQRE